MLNQNETEAEAKFRHGYDEKENILNFIFIELVALKSDKA